MADYREGQKLKGSDGNIYVVRNGVPVRAGASPLVANPSLPLDLQGKSLSNAKSAADLQLTPYQLRKQRAEATTAEIAAKTAQEQYDAQHPKVSDSGLYGDDYLKTLSQSDRAMIKALDEGRLAFPTGAALRAPFWQEKLSQVSQFDPTFDATNFNARAQARSNAIKGKLGQSNNALNTAVGHLGELYQQIGGTASHSGMLGLATTVNHLENKYLRGDGSPGIVTFEQTAGLVADEIEAAYRNGGGADAGVVRGLRSLDPDMSREQKQAIVKNAINLLSSKIAANVSQYNFGTQGGKPTWDMLDAHTKSILDTIAPDIRDKYFAPPAGQGGLDKNGKADYGDMGGGTGMSAVPVGDTTRTEPFSEGSSFIDSAIAQGMPYREALSGYRSQFPDAPVPDPKQYNDALAYHRQHPEKVTGYGAASKIVPLSARDQQNNSLSQSGPVALAGHFGNGALGGLPTALMGDQGAFWNATSNQQHPYLSGAGDIGGAVAGTLGIGKGLNLGAQAAERSGLKFLSPAAEKYLARPGLRAATADTLYGGTYGASQNPDDPVAGAALGAGAMLLGNVAGRYAVGPGIAAAGNTRLGGKVAGMFGGVPTPKLPVGERMIASSVGKGAPDILPTLDEAASLNLPYALADANPKLRALAGSATRKSPNVLQLAENTLEPRQLGQADRALNAIDTHLAPRADLSQITADATTRAQAASRELYGKAMTHPAPEDHALSEMLGTPAGEKAAREAYQIALNNGEKPGSLSFHLNEDGTVRIDGNPSWKTLHYMRQGMDSVIEKSRDPVSGKLNASDPATKALTGLRSRFSQRLHDLNPDFAAADSAYAKFADQGGTAERGFKSTAPGVTPQQVQGAVANTAPESLPYFGTGYASSLGKTVENTPFASNPYKRIYGSPAQQAKIGTVFPNGADRFGRINALEGDMGKTYQEALGGSPTQPRAEADRAFTNGPMNMAGDLAFTAATGTPTPGLLKHGLSALAGDTWKMGLGKSAQKKAEQLGPILFNTDPAASADFVRQLMEAQKARQAYTAWARAGGGMFGAPMAAPFIGNP